MARAVFAYGFSLALLLAVGSPALRDPPEDSFPFSDYPMFSHGRPHPMLTITQALGVRRETRTPLEPMVSAGNREVLQSMMTIQIAVSADAVGYCREVAARVAADDDLVDVEAVEIATSTWDTVAYFETGPEPISRHVLVRCPVQR